MLRSPYKALTIFRDFPCVERRRPALEFRKREFEKRNQNIRKVEKYKNSDLVKRVKNEDSEFRQDEKARERPI